MIGHHRIEERLRAELPAVSLFLGPRSVGKWTMAEYVAALYGYDSAQQSLVRCEALSAQSAGAVARMARFATPRGRLFIVRIDQASGDVVNTLLKTLEERAERNRFILISADHVPETVVSRCTVFRFSLLSEEEVRLVLQGLGWSPDQASLYAPRGRGQVGAATTAATADWFDAKTTVGAALNAILNRDEETLLRLGEKWTDAHTVLMETLCRESLTSNHQVFSEDDCEGLARRLALRVLFSLRADVRPRLVVRSSLVSVLRSL